jgi:phage-related protein
MAERKTRVVYYRDHKGREPVKDYLDELARTNPRAAAKIDRYVDHYLNGQSPSAPPPKFPISSQVSGRVRELRVRFANTRYRLFYAQSGERIGLLHIVEKNTPRLLARDRDLAMRRFEDFGRGGGGEPPAAGRVAPRRPRTRY